jgi:hypothetical protein
MLMVLVVCLALFPATWADSRGNISFTFAGRVFEDSDTWAPVDEQFALGGRFDFAVPSWPVNWSFGLYTSSRDKNVSNNTNLMTGIELSVFEASTGVVKYWGKTARPYLGGGFSLMNIDTKGIAGDLSQRVDDTTLGAYIEGGILFRVGKLFQVGVDARALYADTEFLQVDTSASYYQVGLLLGWGWGPSGGR